MRVAVVSTEGPSELGARADVVVGSTEELARLLAALTRGSEAEQLAHAARLAARDVELRPRRVVEHEPQAVVAGALHRCDLREVDDVRAVDAREALRRQRLLELAER